MRRRSNVRSGPAPRFWVSVWPWGQALRRALLRRFRLATRRRVVSVGGRGVECEPSVVARVAEQQAGAELVGGCVGRGDLCKPFGDIGERRRSSVAREHSVGPARRHAPVRSRKPVIATAHVDAAASRDRAPLRVPHRSRGVDEAFDVAGVLGSADVQRPVDPRRPSHRRDLGGLLALALGLEPLHECVAGRDELVGRGRQQLVEVLLVQALDDTHTPICTTSCTPAMRSTRSMCGLTPISRSDPSPLSSRR